MTRLRFTKDRRYFPPKRVQTGYWAVEFDDPESLRTTGVEVDRATASRLVDNVKGFKREVAKGRKRDDKGKP